MSEIQNAIRAFADKIAKHETDQAAYLGTVQTGLRDTVDDTRRRITTALAKAAEGRKMVEEAETEILAAMDDADRARMSINAEIEKLREVKLSPTGKLKMLPGGKSEEAANG